LFWVVFFCGGVGVGGGCAITRESVEEREREQREVGKDAEQERANYSVQSSTTQKGCITELESKKEEDSCP